MSKTTLTYEEILSQLKKAQSENKKLRLRPSVHSPDANIFEFMDIKAQLAKATLAASTINEAIEICVKYICKITNIHSASFFLKDYKNHQISLIKQQGLPKKFIAEINNSDFLLDKASLFFPQEANVFYFDDIIEKNNSFGAHALHHLKGYHTLFILPIIKNTELDISTFLLSKKELHQDKYIKVLYQSILSQLNSTFSRIIMTEKLKTQADNLSNKISERAIGFEKMNLELLQQIKTHKHNEHNISEELELFKSITLQQKDLVLRINKEGQILYNNPPFVHVKKMNNEHDENVLNYFGNGDFPGLDFIIQDFEKNIQRVNCEIQMNASGIQWFNVSFIPIRNKRGLLTEIQIAARNINEIKKLEYKLLFQRKMLFSMLNTMDHVSFTISKNGIIDLIYNNIQEITGVTPIILRDKNYENFVHPSDIKTIKNSIRNLIKRDKPFCLFNFRLKHHGETWPWQKAKLKLVFNDKEKASYFVGYFYPFNKDEASHLENITKYSLKSPK